MDQRTTVTTGGDRPPGVAIGGRLGQWWEVKFPVVESEVVVHPIPQSVEVARLLELSDPDLDILSYLHDLAQSVRQGAPGCIGMSIAWLRQGVALTLVASDEEIAALDAVQYLDGGPCVDTVIEERGLAVGDSDFFDEDRWRLFARSAIQRGVASSLSIPLTEDSTVPGSVNLYGSSPHTFTGNHEALAAVLGEHAATLVTNADLSFSTRGDAERAPEELRSQIVVSQGDDSSGRTTRHRCR